MAADPDHQAWSSASPLSAASSARSRPSGTASGAASSWGDRNTGATIGPQDASPPCAGQAVRRVLFRRNIVIDAETAQLVAAAVQAALQAGAPSRPPRRGPRVPAADCEPLF